MSDPALIATVSDDLGFINLRGDPGDAAFVAAVEKVLGQALPVAANTLSQDKHRVYWLGPNEWLVVTAREASRALVADLETALAGQHVAINDVSGGNVATQLRGESARDVLAKGCTLDLHPDRFEAGACAQSGLAKASVVLGCIDADPTFEIIVRRSFAPYLDKWLRHAGREYGIEFT